MTGSSRRVLMLHARYTSPGGEDQSALAETALLREAGHDVRLVELRNADIGPLVAAGRQFFSHAIWQRVCSEILAFRPDVMWVQNTAWAWGPTAIMAASACGVPIIAALRNERLLVGWRDAWRGDSHACSNRGQAAVLSLANPLHRRLTWRRHVDVLVPVSEFIRQRFIAAGFDSDQLVAKPNAVSPEPKVEPRPVKRQILFAGRLVPEKGVGVLVEAWRMLGDDAPELLIVGDGPMWPGVGALEGCYRERILWLGAVLHADLLTVMAESLAVIVPSLWAEPFGRTAIEALAAGTPTIVSRVGGLPETQPTICDDLSRPEAICAAVRTVLGLSPARMAEWRAEARRRYEEHFSAARQLAHMERIMALAVERRAAQADHRRAVA